MVNLKGKSQHLMAAFLTTALATQGATRGHANTPQSHSVLNTTITKSYAQTNTEIQGLVTSAYYALQDLEAAYETVQENATPENIEHYRDLLETIQEVYKTEMLIPKRIDARGPNDDMTRKQDILEYRLNLEYHLNFHALSLKSIIEETTPAQSQSLNF